MTLSMTTHGMLWPRSAIFREQFTNLDTSLDMVGALDTTVDIVDCLEATYDYDDLVVVVEPLEEIDSSMSDVGVEIDLNPCD